MRRLSDDMIVGLYAPRGVGTPLPEGQRIVCARGLCPGVATPGARAHRWASRQPGGGVIELCPRCHAEMMTIISGG